MTHDTTDSGGASIAFDFELGGMIGIALGMLYCRQ